MSKLAIMMCILLRWPKTGFAFALAHVIQRVHKDCKKCGIDTAIILFTQCLPYLCHFFLHN